jgi:CubicO group peptidase (beta-lactamase class C family)
MKTLLIFSTLLLGLLWPSKSMHQISADPGRDSLHAPLRIQIPFVLPPPTFDDEFVCQKRNIIHQYYKKHMANVGFSGGFIVAKNGVVLYEDYQGFADMGKQQAINSKTALHLASISKVFTATAVLRLVQAQKITLDQAVIDILPDFPYADITVRQLLNHRSGLPHYSSFSACLKRHWNRKKTLTNQDILQLLSNHKIRRAFLPDQAFRYCNTNYVIAALIVEKITQQPFPIALKQLVFDPLDMKQTFVFDYQCQRDSVSRSFRGKRAFGWDQFDALYGDKNVYSTPRDLVKYDLATYSPDFLSSALWEEAFKGYSPNRWQKNYGLGIRMHEWPNGQKLHYHNGWWHGSKTSYLSLKKDSVSIIALGNNNSNRPYLTLKLAGFFGDYPVGSEKLDIIE